MITERESMRIIDRLTNQPLTEISIFLAKDELRVLQGYAKQLLRDPVCEHVHFMDDEYKREITLASYSQDGNNSFAKEVNEILEPNGDQAIGL